ncbi:FAD-dependent oxidoreductase [Wolbachia endosymbiont of Drosophila malagassya]|uniref:FAD-dependent oxidoreductase n=1 Tax=Wolbachia endosymbiont of Drosophila seguyi TaxID=3002581 RepID=UPI0023AA122C|nr:FAD-dependent oxidoreductase [Wolbachia endosymbiont of Drosophila seguyi]MDE5066200.1 FAD-dependent oxidoreductase [Wolbachia endosymbiont of Drosophila seguyi]MDU8923022.1 FAD-dependent oxidoreductase [Wolbachia endosymbiont of Drosophila seguyi]MDU8941074.1 FAD-dependent oxidoreductase [Wolbachia endosymbiont of Drosophila malagassya]
MKLNFKISFSNLYTRNGLTKLDETFLNYIKSCDESLFCSLIEAREKAASSSMSSQCHPPSSQCLTLGSRKQEERSATWMTDSQLIIDLSYLLDEFIAKLFNVEKEIEELKKKHNDFAVIYKCKRLFVQRYALKKYTNVANIDITNKLSHFLTLPTTEKNFAEQVMHWFEDKENHKEEIELAAQYAVRRVKNKQSILFSIHKKIDHENLIPFSKKEVDKVEVLYSNEVKRRYGFDLTSEKASLDKALDNAHYCIFCHKQSKDSCSKGLINDDNTFKKSPLRVELHGCPLEQKISEMNLVKSEGYSIASLAIVMIDNPLCAATGHRICNDCMNSCIYQKQEPVNVPAIETRILDDVLSLPYGFEIYSLLSRWNPLNFQRSLPRENTGKNVLVVGLGPAGFNLAHHLLNDGHNVITIDGLKIEPLIDNFQLIKDFKHEKLSERTAGGFGGVAEYGITSRWDKNYLKIIRLLLERRENFVLYGGIRFGGTINADDAFNLGFDHIALALGSGKPRMIKIKNILARGVRMASDFLMSLQLTGALKFDSIANLQVRMPIVVIGAGLTAIDTATEALAYYPIQVEKFLLRYEILVDKYGKDCVEKDWTEEEREIANEFISHAQLIREKQKLAKKGNREIKILELMQSLGGVKVIYRKELKDSPSYRLNSEEVQNALSEGIYFIENLEPVEVVTDKYNHAELIKLIDTKSGEIKRIKARSIFIAAGTEPNTVIATEDKKHFKLSNGYFTHLNSSGKEIDPIFSPKMQNKDRILVYKQGNKTISFFGDLHPSYSGSVVKAMASAKNGYPIISQLLSGVNSFVSVIPVCDVVGQKKNAWSSVEDLANKELFNRIKEQFTAKVIKVQYLTDKVVEIVIKAPLAAKNFKPGQFFRLQNFETNGRKANNTNLAMEGIAVTGTEVDKKKGIISTIVLEIGGSTNLCRHLREGEQIILMGPTGRPTEVY